MASATQHRDRATTRPRATMVQVAKFLGLNEQDMEQRIAEELDANPLLSSDYDPQQSLQDMPSATREEDMEEDYNESTEEESSSSEEDATDWEDYEVNEPVLSEWDRTRSEQTLAEDLLVQFNASIYCDPSLHRYVKGLVYRMNSRGIIDVSLESLKAEFKSFFESQGYVYSEHDLLAAIKQVQSLDPPGVGAVGEGFQGVCRSMSIQLERKIVELEQVGEEVPDSLEDALEIVDEYFEELRDKDPSYIYVATGWDKERFDAAWEEIKRLQVAPVSSSVQRAPVIVPDFVYDPETHDIAFRGRPMGTLLVNDDYVAMAEQAKGKQHRNREDEALIDYVRTYQPKATQFIELVELRRQALTSVMGVIAQRQRAYLLSGNEGDILPLTMQEVADAAQVDTSTVSRVVNNRYIELPGGMVPLRKFFAAGLATIDGGEVARTEVLDRLQELVTHEDPHHPLSDQKLADILTSEGYQVALRTVNKYRTQLQIPSSNQRKQ